MSGSNRIKKLTDKTHPIIHVIKVGGAHLSDENYVKKLSGIIKTNIGKKIKTILVHGGGKEIETLHTALNIPCAKTSEGLRVTSDESMPLVTMTLSGLVNKRLALWLNNFGIQALGVSGVDRLLMRSRLLNEEKLGRVGGPPIINNDALFDFLKITEVLVISSVCAGFDGKPVNVNADIVGQAIAISIQANELDFITDVDAIIAPSGPIQQLNKKQIPTLINNPIVTGGMIPKLQASLCALEGGVDLVRVGSIHSIKTVSDTQMIA